MNRKIKIMGISGSLRPGSAASAVLRFVSELSPNNIEFNIYDGLEQIPPFNDDQNVPITVNTFLSKIEESDGVFICTPEYAYGVPGALKNAIDWTVSTTAFYDKPVAVITASSSGEKAHASLLLTLTALHASSSAETNLLVSAVRSKLNELNELKDAQTQNEIINVLNSFIENLKNGKLAMK